MDTLQFAESIVEMLPFEPTHQQVELVAALARYCSANTPSDSVFLLNGYAGTGKTSVTGALVKALPLIGMRAVLLAPTGRAAKVLSAHAGHPAFTIHRRIYRHASVAQGMIGITGVAENRSANTVFIVDEASMIADDSAGNGSNLLEDLIHYVFSGINCRLILSGDTAQLPPPGSAVSPAMTPDVLRAMGLRVTRATITKTVRQSSHSGILYNATLLRRDMLTDPIPMPRLLVSRFNDVRVTDSEDLQDALDRAYTLYGITDTLLITRSNRRAVQFNLAIRSSILDYETELVNGEPLMIAKNNYYWTRSVKEVDFIANGDIAIVDRIYGTETRGQVRYADVALRLPDHGGITLDAKIMLSSLTSEAPALDPELQRLHIDSAVNDSDLFAPDTPWEQRMSRLKDSPYFNALQVKYGYAVTCHKAQGGQWNAVFVDMGMIQPEALTTLDFYRWLYTATTRAVKEVTYIAPTLTVK
ncbi:MAG: AAA family ATPase [Clostridiales bacterium]|nr:AAA family ATPase [Clostridiales bacterium]